MKTVKGGFYFDPKSWDFVTVNGKTGLLPSKGSYVKVPASLMLLAAPALGAALVIFLPFIGIALFLKAALQEAVFRSEHLYRIGSVK